MNSKSDVNDSTWQPERKRIHWNTASVILCSYIYLFFSRSASLTLLPVHLFQSPSTLLSSHLFLPHAHPQHPFSPSRSRIIHRQIFIYSSNWIVTVPQCIVFCSVKDCSKQIDLRRLFCLQAGSHTARRVQQLLTINTVQLYIQYNSLYLFYSLAVPRINCTKWKGNSEVCQNVSLPKFFLLLLLLLFFFFFLFLLLFSFSSSSFLLLLLFFFFFFWHYSHCWT